MSDQTQDETKLQNVLNSLEALNANISDKLSEPKKIVLKQYLPAVC